MAQFSFTAGKIRAITKDDNNDLPGGRCLAIKCDSAGTVNFVDATDTLVSPYTLEVGYHNISVKRVKLGGTATGLWALYEVP